MTKFKEGYIHSIETLGLVDGEGIRVVVFMQGCPLRCLYCHNPDTWNTSINQQMTVDEILPVDPFEIPRLMEEPVVPKVEPAPKTEQ